MRPSYSGSRIVRGLDGAMVDADVLQIEALDAADSRVFDLRVAGPAALIVAKLHKIDERRGTARSKDKDALDVFRLLRGVATEELAAGFARVLTDNRARSVALQATELLRTQFSTRRGRGVEMTIRAIGALGDPEEIAASCEALTRDLLDAVES